MSKESAFSHLDACGFSSRITYFDVSSATVALAAEALGCNPENIAKTLALGTKNGPILILASGTSKLDNKKFKYRFSTKASFLKPEELLEYVGHEIGGVCPFGLKTNVPVYLDVSLKGLDPVYPAAGTANSAVLLHLDELSTILEKPEWVDVMQEKETPVL